MSMNAEQLDILQRSDPFGRQLNHSKRGFGIWSITANHGRHRPNGEFDSRSIVVIYDDERYVVQKTRRRWIVEVRHYLSFTATVTTGWGGSRRVRRERKQRFRSSSWSFSKKVDAMNLADKLDGILRQMEGG